MATNKPRVTVTLEPEDYELFREMASLQGRSISSQIADLVHVSAPYLAKVRDTARALEKADRQARQHLSDQFAAGERVSLWMLEHMGSDLDAARRYLEEHQEELPLADADARGMRAPRRQGKRRQPPSSNTGATTPVTPLRKPKS